MNLLHHQQCQVNVQRIHPVRVSLRERHLSQVKRHVVVRNPHIQRRLE